MYEPLTKKSLGQHWLHDPQVLGDIAGAAEINPNDTILEIGPGLGTLTKLLTEQAEQVVAVEFDETLALQLPQRVTAKNLEVVQQDIMQFDLTQLPVDYKVVANIPYYLTSNLIRALSESRNLPKVAVLLIQKEVAQRVAAEPGQMSILAVTAQYFWEVELGNLVPARMFTPPPKVDSQVLILTRRDDMLQKTDTKGLFRMAKAGFSQKRKTLLNSLSGGLAISRSEVHKLCAEAGIDTSRRAQTLSIPEWQALFDASERLKDNT